MAAGMDVARLNFSHGKHEDHRKVFGYVRAAAAKLGRNVAIMQDLQGPKIRVGVLPEKGIQLKKGDVILLFPEGTTPRTTATGKILIPVSADIAEPISRDLRKGARILFNDGLIECRTTHVEAPEMVAEITVGGLLTSRKGMNLPGTPLSMPCLTKKDLEDLKLGLELGVDAIALSFVRRAEDIQNLRDEMKRLGNTDPLVVAKIEREEAVDGPEGIIELSDGLLVARGDMAVELGAHRVPVVQKELIHACGEIGVPIITATQMLESMVHAPTPTRAEASDVANAVFDGTDAVMLSAETASGEYPVEAVKMMARIIEGAEKSIHKYTNRPVNQPVPGSIIDSIEFAAARIANEIGATAIACVTHMGTSARAIAKYRPDIPIVAVIDRPEVLRRLAFVWGVEGILIPSIVPTDDLFMMLEEEFEKRGMVSDGDLIVVTAGIPSLRRGTTNTVKVHRVGSPMERMKIRL